MEEPNDSEAVSYTHLDVYKRQRQNFQYHEQVRESVFYYKLFVQMRLDVTYTDNT